MNNHVSGDVRDTGTLVQVHQVAGDILLHREPPRRRWITQALVVRLLLAIVLVAAQQCVVGGLGDNGLPAGEKLWPSGVDKSVLIRLVSHKLTLCEAETVAAPVNCPQHSTVGEVNEMYWTFAVDPSDEMRVEWQRGRFVVSGTAVMTATYLTKDGELGYEIKLLRYSTELRWCGREPNIHDVGRISSDEVDPAVSADEAVLNPDVINAAVAAKFDACMETTESPLPLTCPRASGTPQRSGVRWTSDNNPVRNTNIEHYPEFGLARITGSYSLTASSLQVQSPVEHQQRGNYRATVVRTRDGAARVLEIRHVP